MLPRARGASSRIPVVAVAIVVAGDHTVIIIIIITATTTTTNMSVICACTLYANVQVIGYMGPKELGKCLCRRQVSQCPAPEGEATTATTATAAPCPALGDISPR